MLKSHVTTIGFGSGCFTVLLLNPVYALASENQSMLSSSLRMIWGLLIVLGILLIIYGLVKKRTSLMGAGGNGLITVVETRHLMPKKSLYLIEVRGKEFLLGAGTDSIELLAALGPTPPRQSFDHLLQNSEQSNSA